MPRPRWRRIVLVAALALVGAGAFLWQWSKSPPAWYQPPDPGDAKVVALADRFEYGLVEHAQKIRPEGDSWTIRVRAEHMNAWLAARLPAWIAHDAELEWPSTLGTPQVHLEPGVVHLAVPVALSASPANGPTRTVVVSLRPRIVDGGLALTLDRIAMGKLSMSGQPMSNLVSMVEQVAPRALENEQVQRMIDVLWGRELIDPVMVLADGRRVRATRVVAFEGFAEITARTMQPE